MENFFDGKTLKAIQTVSKADGDVKPSRKQRGKKHG